MQDFEVHAASSDNFDYNSLSEIENQRGTSPRQVSVHRSVDRVSVCLRVLSRSGLMNFFPD